VHRRKVQAATVGRGRRRPFVRAYKVPSRRFAIGAGTSARLAFVGDTEYAFARRGDVRGAEDGPDHEE